MAWAVKTGSQISEVSSERFKAAKEFSPPAWRYYVAVWQTEGGYRSPSAQPNTNKQVRAISLRWSSELPHWFAEHHAGFLTGFSVPHLEQIKSPHRFFPQKAYNREHGTRQFPQDEILRFSENAASRLIIWRVIHIIWILFTLPIC